MDPEEFELLVNLYFQLQTDISYLEKKIQKSCLKLKELGITFDISCLEKKIQKSRLKLKELGITLDE